MEQSPTEGFKDPSNLNAWTKRVLYAYIIIAIAAIFSGIAEYRLLKSVQQETYTSEFQLQDDADASDRRQLVIAGLQLVAAVVSGILILCWIYRANYNARQLGAENMQFSPRWSVGWYFIPLMNLWKPYQVMKEIWDFSHNPKEPLNAPAATIVGQWWAFWLLAAILGQLYVRLSSNAEGLDRIVLASGAGVASDVALVFLSSALLRIINQVYEQQMLHYRGPASGVVHS